MSNNTFKITTFADYKAETPLCPYCQKTTDCESEFGYICEYCWIPFIYCEKCSLLDKKSLVVMECIKWGIK
jgi:tRNA(Ile2) C34 agmatinyltransferase TiaS